RSSDLPRGCCPLVAQPESPAQRTLESRTLSSRACHRLGRPVAARLAEAMGRGTCSSPRCPTARERESRPTAGPNIGDCHELSRVQRGYRRTSPRGTLATPRDRRVLEPTAGFEPATC